MKTLLLTCLSLALFIQAGISRADDDFSPEQARQMVEQGTIKPLDDLLQIRPLPGKLLDTELEREDGVLVYELKWLDADDRRHETYVDANSGEWLEDEIDD